MTADDIIASCLILGCFGVMGLSLLLLRREEPRILQAVWTFFFPRKTRGYDGNFVPYGDWEGYLQAHGRKDANAAAMPAQKETPSAQG